MRCNRFSKVLAIAAVIVLVLPAAAKEIPAQLPDPDSTPPDTNKPVKVYIMSGQSNMVGMGQISGGTSRWGQQISDPIVSVYSGAYSPTADYDKLTPITTKKLPVYGGVKPTPFPGGGTQVVRGFIEMKTSGVYKFNPGYSNSSYNIMEVDGVEVYRKEVGKEAVRTSFKFTGGKRYPFKITFLTKAAGGLGWCWRTDIPGLLNTVVKVDKKFPHLIDDKDGDDHWSANDPYKDIKVWYAGLQYDDFVKGIHGVLDNFATNFPQYKDQGYEIAGFVWWQGHKDGNSAHASRYELNLVNLIKAFRTEFKAPKAPFVIATIGFGGWDMAGPHLTVANAQLAVSGEKGKYPEFAGNVKTIDARKYWRDKTVSPSGAGYHYNHNAGTYMDVGNDLGWAMAELLAKAKK